MKRKIAIALVGMMTVMSLASCGQQAPAATDTGAQTVAETVEETPSDADLDAMADAIAEAIAEEQASAEEETQAGAEEAAKDAAEETTEATPAPENKAQATIALKLPDAYIKLPTENRGTAELITYTTHDYVGNGEDVEKNAYVYLPGGYDESQQYNVIYLMHGIGGNEKEWGLNDSTSRVRKILDNLINNGDIDPVIVVAPNGRAFACEPNDGTQAFYYFGLELRNDLIPYIESHYSTYAEYDENGYDLTAARTHRAMCGLSMGGMQTINIGICECLDIMSWFGAFSAAPTSYNATSVASHINDSEYEVDFFYNICGTEDTIAYASASAAAKTLPAFTEKITANENFLWQEKTGAHDFNIWNLGFYNFAQIAFKGYTPAEE